MTMTRSCTSTWVAARPTPRRAYMRLEHVVDQVADALVDRGHRLGDGVQARVGVAKDRRAGPFVIEFDSAAERAAVDAAQRKRL